MVGHALANASPKIGERQRPCVGIAADPDTLELNEEWFAKARPVSEAHPQIVEAFRRRNPSPPQYGRKYSATAMNGISKSIIVMP